MNRTTSKKNHRSIRVVNLHGAPFWCMVSNTILWVGAFVFYGLGDYITTLVGLRHESVEERVPLLRYLIGPKPSATGLIFVKISSLSVCASLYMLLASHPHRWFIPAVLVVLGVAAVVNNLLIIKRVSAL
ncbi:DUF5658 family protein [Haloferax profundi]|uniref:DUF5658 family protein n=1 Tax=Haloferax profundi TaxID=1544718 RepID=UPI0012FC001A|nr:DUF5658 family protein [Haloferax profundi]